MIATIAVIAAIAEKKKNLYETTLQRLQRQQSLRYKNIYLSHHCHCDHWRLVSIWSLNIFFSVIATITAIVAITWKPGLMYRNNRPPFLLNCYLYALQTCRTHSSKLRLLLVIIIIIIIIILIIIIIKIINNWTNSALTGLEISFCWNAHSSNPWEFKQEMVAQKSFWD